MIAILLATHNGSKYIVDQLESIINQTCTDFTCYICDDDSDDNTIELIEEYVRRFPSAIKLLPSVNYHSSTRTFMSMLTMVESDLYMYADQDDVWDRNKIAIFLEEYEKIPDKNKAIMMFSDLYVVDAELHIISDSFLTYNRLNPKYTSLSNIVVQNVVAGCACMFNSQTRDACIRNVDLGCIIQHDWWSACVAAALGELYFINRKLGFYRQHDNNQIGAKKDLSIDALSGYFWNLIRLKQYKLSQERTRLCMQQAAQLCNVELNNHNQELVDMCRKLYSFGKIKRIQMMHKCGIKRNKRNLWMYITV